MVRGKETNPRKANAGKNNLRKRKPGKSAAMACSGIVSAVAMAAVAVSALELLAIRPGSPRNADLVALNQRLFAHRGLHGLDDKTPENSIAAFENAVAQGFGIELDVRLTSDGVPVVFHDENLKRMCGVEKQVSQCSYDEIRSLFLSDTDMGIPTLEQVLETVGGRQPVCIEIKSASSLDLANQAACEVGRVLETYKGFFVVISFNPLVLRTLFKKYPNFIRGQLVTNFLQNAKNIPFLERLGLNNLLFNFLGRPNFFSYDVRSLSDLAVRFTRRAYPRIGMAWVVKNQKQLDVFKDDFELLVFEGFIPNLR